MDELISVIIPIYNMEKYLARCLDSVLSNSYKNLEVICIDDGSKDSSPAILRSYAEKDSRVVVISKENGGVSSARNAGLDRITGDYVALVDPDDLIHPQFFELMLLAAQSHESSLVICKYRLVEDKDFPLQFDPIVFNPEKTVALNRLQFFQNHNYRSYCGGRLFPSKKLRELRFRENLCYSEDSLFIAELAESASDWVCVVLDEDLYYYYQRDDSLVKQASIANRYLAAAVFAEKALAAENNDIIYLDQAVKGGLSTRYYATHIYPDRQIARKCTECLKSCLPVLRRTAIFSWKNKAIYSMFIVFPGLYWLFRSITEPYMWKWEKVERKKRREEKKNHQV